MNKKKIFMTIVLIVFIIIIGIVIININNVSTQKIMEKSQTSASNDTMQNAKINKNEMIEITDNFFIEQTNDVYLNLDSYIGKNIKIEGLIYSYMDTKGNVYYAVVRNTPGCCGNDGLAGVDVRYDKEYPPKDTWVEAVGTIQKENVDGRDIPAIKIITLNTKEKGKDFVTN